MTYRNYPVWKFAAIIIVTLLSFIYAIPNLYPDDPAIQISGAGAGSVVGEPVLNQAIDALKAAGIDSKGKEFNEHSALIRLVDTEAQLKAKALVQTTLGEKYIVALNLAPTTPKWLLNLAAKPMRLGLDLRGGVHFVMEVDMDKALSKRFGVYIEEIKDRLREEKLRYSAVSGDYQNGLTLKFGDEKTRDDAATALRRDFVDFIVEKTAESDSFLIKLKLSPVKLKSIQDYAISQNLTTLRNRVNELGVAEPIVQRQGQNRIVIQLPGVQDTADAKRVLGRTASLEFRMVDWEHDARTALSGEAPIGSEIFPFKKDDNGKITHPPVLLKKKVIVTGEQVVDAKSGFDENGRPQVNISLDSKGGTQMNRVTRDHIHDSMAVLFVESKPKLISHTENGQAVIETKMIEEKYAINVATIQSALGSQFRITGLDSQAEAAELALLLRSGALAAPMYYVEERTVGPSLGRDNIEVGVHSALIGFIAVLVFMLYYRVFGLFANLALLLNLLMTIAIMSILGATLTLPGIAGIVVGLAISVDANVLINSRIKEELANGLAPRSAIDQGYDRAFGTILDANLTTLIVAAVLYAIGTGSVKGFAVTLSIGLLCSMFTAITGTRALSALVYGGKVVKKLSI